MTIEPSLTRAAAAGRASYQQLLADKAEKLGDLLGRKPGHEHYRRSLRAFLEADAKAEKALIARMDPVAWPPEAAAE